MTTTPATRERTQLSFGRAFATSTELKMPDDLTIDEWEAIGRQLNRLGDAVKWWIGDWLNRGKWSYGDRYRVVREVLDANYADVRDIIYVAGNVPPAIRDPGLAWWHHRLVAKLIPAEQEVWLQRARDENWSTRELAEQLRGATQLSEGDEPPPVLEQLRLTVDPDRLSRYEAAAARVESTFSEWAIAVLDAEAERSEAT